MSIFDIADLSTGFFDALYTIILFEAFLERKENVKPWIYYAGAVALGCMINVSNHLFSTNLLNMMVMIILELLFSILYIGSASRRTIAAIFSFMVSSVSEIVVLMCMSILLDGHVASIIADGTYRIIGIAVSKSVGTALSVFVYYKIKRKMNLIDSVYWILFLLVLLSIIITVHTFYLVLAVGVDKVLRIRIYICTAGLIMTCITILFLYDRNTKQRSELSDERLISNSLKDRMKHYSEIAEAYDRTQSLRHDLKNHLLTVRAKAERGDLEDCIAYIDNIIGNSPSSARFDTGNTALDAMLGAKKEEAEKKGIRFKTKLTIPPQLPLADEDTCVIFGNALDNAIEACEKLDSDRYIFVLIKYDGKDLICRIENSCPKNTSVTNKTTKPNKHEHGIGRRNIERALEKYSAFTDTEVHDGAYILSILFENIGAKS